MTDDTPRESYLVRKGKVIAIHSHGMTIQMEADRGCAGCGRHKACHPGQSVMIDRIATLTEDDELELGIRAIDLTLSALSVYLLPAVTTIAGALIGDHIGGDLPSLIGSLVGTASGLIAHRVISTHWLRNRLKPLAFLPEPPYMVTSCSGDH